VIVTFRSLGAADSARLLAWRNSPQVAAYMYTDHVIGEAEHQSWILTALQAPDRRYWIVEADAAPVGLANLANIDRVARRCELGHYVADPAMRGKGVGACIEYLLLQHVFQTLGLNKLWCEVLLENERAWRLHLNFGFRREALFRQHVRKGDRFLDVVGLGILASEWVEGRAACVQRLSANGVDVSALRIRET
jgi:UDP-4-amino-4,6-dideoxy-N-acetyl-beta-L-altrosamine N-acetyltransferase